MRAKLPKAGEAHAATGPSAGNQLPLECDEIERDLHRLSFASSSENVLRLGERDWIEPELFADFAFSDGATALQSFNTIPRPPLAPSPPPQTHRYDHIQPDERHPLQPDRLAIEHDQRGDERRQEQRRHEERGQDQRQHRPAEHE